MVVVVLALAVVAVGLLAAITGRALPQTSGTLGVSGLDQPVSVARDRTGIAHITAGTAHDLFMAQGFVHAQERFWQMEVWRRIGAGRLSELFGEATLSADTLVRTLDWRSAAARDLAAASPEVRSALDAYTAGVNAWLDANRGRLGLAFLVAGLRSGAGLGGFQPEPWTALDSATWQKVQAFQLGGNYSVEIFRMLADARLGDRTDELFRAYPADAPVITPSGLPGSGGAGASGGSQSTGDDADRGSEPPKAVAASVTDLTASSQLGPERLSETAAEAWRHVAGLRSTVLTAAGLDAGDGMAGDHGIGSNNWVVAPSLSATGSALLANDPHLGLSMPSVWYMNGLHCRPVSPACPYDVAGVSFPGTPFVVLGRNSRIAWGATNAGPDVMDLFIESVDPANSANYLENGRSVPFAVRDVQIEIAGAEPVNLQLRSTGHGPVINDIDSRLRNEDRPIALRWTALAAPDSTLDAIRELNVATDFVSFRTALSKFRAPAQNFVYADVDGHIGYQLPGLIPIRAPGDDGRRPVDGASGAHEWAGYIPFDDLPRQLDPPAGIIVTANNATVDGRYPHIIGTNPDPGYRAQRALELLATARSGGITTEEMRAIQLDSEVPRARLVIPHLDRIEPASADGRAILDLARTWDGRCDVDSRGCAAYLVFEQALLRQLFDDDLGPLARDYVGSTESWQALIAFLDAPEAAWWDDAGTVAREGALEILASALDAAGRDLRTTLGDPARWSWGRLHRLNVVEPTLGTSGIGLLEWYFNQGPVPIAGAAGALNNQYYRQTAAYPNPDDADFQPVDIGRLFWVSNGPSFRITVDLADLDGARVVTSTGQAGNPFDRHYGDLVSTWAGGGTVALPFSQGAIDRAAVSTLTLAP
jgi:penicillin amidase